MPNPSFLLIGITDEQRLPPPEQVEALFGAGLDFLYWRTPVVSTQNLALLSPYAQSRTLLAADRPEKVSAPFRWHLKETHRQQLNAPAFSTSIHQLSDWPRLAGGAEIVFYSPVFPSLSKPGYGPTASIEAIGEQIQTIRHNHAQLPQLIALGGVTTETLPLAQRAGFDGAALLGTLWQSPDPVATIQQLVGVVRAGQAFESRQSTT